jgi:pimeloyl-ACP methyl ester carboxylesterase
MKNLLFLLLFLYFLILGYLYIAQRSFIYFPSFTRPVALAPNYQLSNEGVLLKGWAFNEDRNDAILYFGGNGERLEYNLSQFHKLFPGRAVYMLSYRGYGESEGVPTEKGIYSDALALYDNVSKRHGAVSIIGRSLGSAVATYVAANRETDKIALITPFASIENLAKLQFPIFPVALILKDKHMSVERVGQIESDVLVIYAERDKVVPESSTNELVAGFVNKNIDVVMIEGAGHNTISESVDYEDKLALYGGT